MITRLFSEANIYALGWTVLHSLWQAFLVALIMGLILLFLQRHSARARYWLANAALFTVFMLSVFTFASLKPDVTPASEPAVALFIDPPPAPAVPGLAGSPIETFWSQFLVYFNQHLPVVVTVWLMGLAFFVLRMLGGLLYLQRLRQRADKVAGKWQERMTEIAEALAVSRPVQLLESALANTPMVIGVLKPVILLPLGAVNGLSPVEVEAVLAHELAHIRRQDYLLNIFQSIIEVLYYFNPAVWWISATVRLERENCCDDLAVAFCGNSLIYAKALVKVEELSRRAPAFALAFSSGKNHMLNRVKRILNQSENRSNMMAKLTATLLLLLAIALFSISASRPTDEQTGTMKELISAESAEMERMILIAPDEVAAATKSKRTPSFSNLRTLPAKAMALLMRPDTLPAGNITFNFTRDNGQKINAKIRDGKITYLKLDGKEIPASEYDQYESMVEEIMANELPPPPPPRAPRPPAPPAPPKSGAAPPAPAPPAPPAPPKVKSETKVTTRKGEDGSTIIIIESDGEDPMELRLDENDNVRMNGDVLREGETIVIETEHPSWIGHLAPVDGLPELEMELMRLQQQQIKAEEMAHMREMMQKEREALQKQMENMRAEDRVRMEREIREQMEQVERQAREIEWEAQRIAEEELRLQRRHQAPAVDPGYRSSTLQSRLERQLLSDQLIDSAETYRLELSGSSLQVNGKKQSSALHQKYLDIYLGVEGKPLEGKSKLVIDKSDRK